MTKLAVLTNSNSPNSWAFNAPLIAVRSRMDRLGHEVCFLWRDEGRRKRGDVLLINSSVFRTRWRDDREGVLDFLGWAQSTYDRVIWFDTTDSTWSTQLQVLPWVDRYLKNQVYSDLSLYTRRYRTGRIYTDYLDDLYDAGESAAEHAVAAEEDLHKIGVSWNTCFESYTEKRYSLPARCWRRWQPWLHRFACQAVNINFEDPAAIRTVELSCRFGLQYSRPSVARHREAIAKVLYDMGVAWEKIPLRQFFQELRSARIGIGPFGLGEITLRDFEIIACGAALLKPHMRHMRTWPDLFVEGETYLGFEWDLSDLREKIEELLADDERRVALAKNAQAVYRDAVSESGLDEFASRLVSVLTETPTAEQASVC